MGWNGFTGSFKSPSACGSGTWSQTPCFSAGCVLPLGAVLSVARFCLWRNPQAFGRDKRPASIMQILHLSADYPDPLAPAKTSAIRRLLELVPEVDHDVYSLNRVGPTRGISALSFETRHRAVTYGAAPFGVLHRSFLHRLARWIISDIEDRGMRPSAIHAHKLSVEGLVGDEIAKQFRVPLIVSCQGNSDMKIIGAKPELRPVWRKIWQDADWVLPFAPWTQDSLQAVLGPREAPISVLPCPTEADYVLSPTITGPVVRTAFHLDHHVNKNARLIIEAASIARQTIPGLKLEVIGAGSPTAFADMQAIIGQQPSNTLLVGPILNTAIQQTLNQSACFVMPSQRESYGMVFAEALLAGCPVIHGSSNGISGYFQDTAFAQPVRQGGATALAEQIVGLIEDQKNVKANLAQAQRMGRLEILRRPAIAERYREALYTVTEPAPRQAGVGPAKKVIPVQ